MKWKEGTRDVTVQERRNKMEETWEGIKLRKKTSKQERLVRRRK